MLRYEGRCAQILDTDATTVKMVDDCGNCWDCVLMFGPTPFEHCKIGGEWKRFVEARRLYEGVRLRIGAPVAGSNHTIYVTVVPN
jgi:hypothetical protein